MKTFECFLCRKLFEAKQDRHACCPACRERLAQKADPNHGKLWKKRFLSGYDKRRIGMYRDES